jgi:quinol-cytochrome oxidoreductase complex cytochrome b subunit
MLVLPGAIFGLIGLHLYLVIRLGVTSPPWSKKAAGAPWIEEDAPEQPARKGLVEPAPRGGAAK